MPEKVSLTGDDWAALLPETDYTLGKTKLPLRPLTVAEITKVSKVLQKSMGTLTEKGITVDNYNEMQNMVVLVDIIMEHAPELVSDSAGLALDDVKNLPIEWAVDLLRELIELNISSKTSLEKNLKALAAAITKTQDQNGE